MAEKALIKTIRFMIEDKETPLDPIVADRLQLALLIDLTEGVEEDRKKINKMWGLYPINVWLLGGLGTGFLTVAVAILTGRAQITFP